jgi:Zn-dependent protease with chaperone function
MRWLTLVLIGFALALPARAQDIVDVLLRSQQSRLDALAPAPDGPRASLVRASFERLLGRLQPHLAAELRVITGELTAETLLGRVVVANESLADLPEGERDFILAHELGHVVSGHWLQLGLLYKRWIPGAVTPETTDPVAGPLGREASRQAHRHELEADAYALNALKQIGRPVQDAFSVFLREGVTNDTATHPGTRKRVASLRSAITVAEEPTDAHGGLAVLTATAP